MQDASSAIKRATSGWTVRCFGKREEPESSKHKLALATVHNTRNRQAEFDTKNAEAPTKTVKAVVQVKNAIEAENKNPLAINYEKAAAEAINKVKQDLRRKRSSND